MTATILPFPAAPSAPASASKLGHFVRLGEAHLKLADLFAEGRFPARRVVVDVSRVRHQKELLRALREEGVELVLDTEAAELAAQSRFAGHSKHAPWTRDRLKPLGPDHFRSGTSDVIPEVARFAIENQFHVVLAPAHYLGDPNEANWLDIDSDACVRLREALDREGGRHIAIDYPVLIPHTDLNEATVRGQIINRVAELPVDAVWIRASGLGSDAGPLVLKRYLASLSAMHNLGKPIVADHLAGLTGIASMAFGAVSGIAHGIEERQRFDARNWHLPPPERDPDDGFGRAVRVNIPGLNKSVTLKEYQLLSTAKNGRRLISCHHRDCCPKGFDDMVIDHRRHSVGDAMRAVATLEAVPDLAREHFFLTKPMADAQRIARQVKMLKPSAEEATKQEVDLDGLMKRLASHSVRLEKVRVALERFQESRPDHATRALPISRGGRGDAAKQRTEK